MSICLICEKDRATEIYEGPIRAGSFGKMTREVYKVLLCDNCDTARLHPFPDLRTDYETGNYRTAYNDASTVKDYQKLHDHLETEKLSLLDLTQVRGKAIAEFGCGGGSFLSLLRPLASKTAAIEPNQAFHADLRAAGHEVFSYGSDLIRKKPGEFDTVYSFQVIEHVLDPYEFLKDIYDALQPGGKALLVTPNRHVITAELGIPEFHAFNYRTAHNWYFSSSSLQVLARRVGFATVKVEFQHRYDGSNFVHWLMERRPTGWRKTTVFDPEFDAFWSAWLERKQLSDNLVLKLERS
jgi:2-polyprenyl-3-methyl-5-hydroxy-6-metoxy-1,4-benzoquinol methylase